MLARSSSLAELRPGIKLPLGLEEMLDQALVKERSERYQKAEEIEYSRAIEVVHHNSIVRSRVQREGLVVTLSVQFFLILGNRASFSTAKY